MWKIPTVQIRKEIYYSLICCGLFPEEQKGWYKGTIGTGNFLYINQPILKKSKAKLKNVVVACIENKNTFDMVLQTWMIECL